MDMQITITQWNEDYRKLSYLYKNEENNLIKTFLQEDYSLFKIYKLLIKNEPEKEKINFQKIEKQLKNYINDTYSYFKEKNNSNYFDFQNKIKKIDELFHKIKKDLKEKYDNNLKEEIILEKELENYSKNFEDFFKNEEIKNDKLNEIKEKKNEKLNIKLINKYINNILNNNKEILFNDIEKIIEKLNNSDKEEIKEIIENIINIIEKQFGGKNLGWTLKEHEEFLKLRKEFKNKINNYEFLTALNSLIPYISSLEHKNHIKLYEKYSQLKEIKKLLVNKYNEIKYENEDVSLYLIYDKKIGRKKSSFDFDSNKRKIFREIKNLDNYINLKKSNPKLKKDNLINNEKNKALTEGNYKIKTEEEKINNINGKYTFENDKKKQNILVKKKKANRALSTKNLVLYENFIPNNNIKPIKFNKRKIKIIETNVISKNKSRNNCFQENKGKNITTNNYIIRYKSKKDFQ